MKEFVLIQRNFIKCDMGTNVEKINSASVSRVVFTLVRYDGDRNEPPISPIPIVTAILAEREGSYLASFSSRK